MNMNQSDEMDVNKKYMFMENKKTAMIVQVFIILIAGNLYAQKGNDLLRDSSGGKSSDAPEVLRKFVKKYKEKVQSDSSVRLDNRQSPNNIGLNNLVMDNTLSKAGHDFYEFFYENWDPPRTNRHFTVYINEKPAPGMGNLIQVRINYDKIFRTKLTPRHRALEKVARQAVNKSLSYIKHYKKINQQLGKDLKGTGIY